jgi:hypothetical protein
MLYSRSALLTLSALFVLNLGLASDCSSKPDLKPYSLDNATYANLDEIKTTHIDLNIAVDFEL